MKTNLKNLSVLILSVLLIQVVNAQNKLSIDQVYSVVLRNSGPIAENEQVKGYYFFYQVDKADKKSNAYSLQILDINLNKVKQIDFVDTKDLALLESSFNKTDFLFIFYDYRKGEITYRIYGTDGSEKKNYLKKLSNDEKVFFETQYQRQSDEIKSPLIADIANRGFIAITTQTKGRLSMKFASEINFYTPDGKNNWKYTTEEKSYSNALYIGQEGSVGIFQIINVKGVAFMSEPELEMSILGLDINTGKKLFEISAENKGFKMAATNVSHTQNPNEYIISGPYYRLGDQIWSAQPVGISFWVVDNSGKIKLVKYNSFREQIGKLLPVDEKGRIGNFGYFFMHDITNMQDGKTFVIGEGYVRDKSKVSVTDMLLLEFDQAFNIQKAYLGAKSNTNKQEYKMGPLSNPHTTAMWMRLNGDFDYSFTQMGRNNTSLTVGYTDYDKTKNSKEIVFNSMNYTDNQLSKDKIKFQSDATVCKIFPAKPGFVLFMEYFKREKRLDLHLEKMN